MASDPPELQPLTQGVAITADSSPSPSSSSTTSGASSNGGSSSGSSTTGVVNPEPLSVILWSAVLVGVVARNRLLSRRKAG